MTNETSPLLRPSSPKSTFSRQSEHAIEDEAPPSQKRWSPLFITTIMLLIIVTLGCGDELIQPAQTRVFEAIYCRAYYAEHDPSLIGSDGGDGVAEEYCKGAVVQGEVAMLKGWAVALDSVGMLFVSIPWGYFADTYGRKPVLLMLGISFWVRAAWLQLVCYCWRVLPIKLVWLGSLHTLLGGSSSVANAMAFTVVSDIMSEDGRVTVFFRMAAASMTTAFIGPFTSAVLMKWNPWIPMLLGLGIQIIPIFLAFILPETLNYKALAPYPDSASAHSSNSSSFSTKDSPWRRTLRDAMESFSFVFSDSRLLLTLPAFSIHLLILNRDVLLQYVSTRYSITLANATVLISFRSGFIFLCFLLVFPAFTYLLRTTLRIHPQRADLILSRASTVAMALGFFIIALAPTLPLLIVGMFVNTFGWGLILFLRNLMTSLVEPHHVARLNTFMGVFDTTGLMLGSPALAALYEKGVEIGGMWMGLPFLACAGIVAAIGVLLALIGLWEMGNGQEEEDVRVCQGHEEVRV